MDLKGDDGSTRTSYWQQVKGVDSENLRHQRLESHSETPETIVPGEVMESIVAG